MVYQSTQPAKCGPLCNFLLILLFVGRVAFASNAAGVSFLELNAKKDGVVVLASGLQYKVLRKGDGLFHPTVSTPCECHYAGSLIDGTIFDSSYSRGSPTTFAPNQVIKGWTEAMQMMVEGDKWEMYIPSELGYGDRGRPPKIGGGDVLIFQMEILQIKGRKVPSATCDPGSNPECTAEALAAMNAPPNWNVHIIAGILGLFFIVLYSRNQRPDNSKRKIPEVPFGIALKNKLRADKTPTSESWKKDYFGDKITTKDGVVDTDIALKDKSKIGIYFSAKWCPPCQKFTPVLATFYEMLKEDNDDNIEIIFVSSDKDPESFQEYFGNMPWTAIPFRNDLAVQANKDLPVAPSKQLRVKQELAAFFDLKSIPMLVILDGSDGSIKDSDGRSTIAKVNGSVKKAMHQWK